MLQTLRRQAQSPLIQGIVVVIAIVFIFWGVGTNMMNNRQAALTVNNEEITFQEFQETYERAYESMAAQFGGTLPKGMAESLQIKEQVINQLTQTALLRQGARQMGLAVSQQEIQNLITSMPQFQGDKGFSLERYNALLSANKLTPNKFESSLRVDLLADKVVKEIGKFAGYVSEYEIENLYQQANEQVAVSFLRFSPTAYRQAVSVSDTELADWYETAKEAFKTPAELKMSYLAYSYATLSKDVQIPEEMIASYYRDHQDEFTAPEQRRPRVIFLPSSSADPASQREEKRKQAEGILTRAQNGEDFSALARQYSAHDSKDKGGDIGFIPQTGGNSEMEQTLFAMQPGAVSQLLTTDAGFIILKLEEIKAASMQPLVQVSGQIREQLQKKEAESLAFQRANSAYEGIIGAGSLSSYLSSHTNETLHSTGFFTSANAPAEIAADQALVQAAFALNKGELSSLIKTASGYYIVFADDRKEPVVPELAAVKKEATSKFIDNKAKDLAQQAAAAALKALAGGEKLSALAAAAGLTVQESGLISKKDRPANLPAELLGKIFTLSTAAPLPESPLPAGDDMIVYQFKERKPADSKGKDAELAQYRDSLLQFKRQELLSGFLDQQKKGASITRSKNL